MKNFCLLLFFALVFVGCSDDINDHSKRNADNCWWVDAKTGKGKWIPVSNERTVKNGRYALFYFDGKLYEKGRLVKGNNVDTIINYGRNGEPVVYSFPKKDTIIRYYLKEGFNQIFSQKGNVLAEGIIQSHQIGDKWKIYYESGKIHFIKNYDNGVGWLNEYYENGNIEDSCRDDGKRKLRIAQWFENGKVHVFSEMHAGNFNGVYKSYFPNGQLEFLSQNVDGRIYGEVTQWFENGNLKFKGHIKNGDKDGYQVFYFENGKIKNEGNYTDGQPFGEFKFYNETGKLTSISTIKNGAETNRKDFN